MSMKIIRMVVFRNEIMGGDKDPLIKAGLCQEVRGVVEKSAMALGASSGKFLMETILELIVNGKEFRLFGPGMPRIDAGEEVILHIYLDRVQGVQIVRNGEVIFRLCIPGWGESHFGSRHCFFEEEGEE